MEQGTSNLGKSSTGLDANLAAALCYLLGFITGIVFLAVEKENKFVRFHAAQSTITFAALFVVMVVLGAVPFVGWILSLFLWLATLVLWLILLIKAFQGEWFKLPLVGDVAERQVQS